MSRRAITHLVRVITVYGVARRYFARFVINTLLYTPIALTAARANEYKQ